MEIKFGSWVPTGHLKRLGRFKFGSSVQDRHMYICELEILADFNLVVAQAVRQTVKFYSLPNFPAIVYVHFLNLVHSISVFLSHAGYNKV